MNDETATPTPGTDFTQSRRTRRAIMFGDQVMGLLRDFLPTNSHVLDFVEDCLRKVAYDHNLQIIQVPEDLDKLEDTFIEQQMLEKQAELLQYVPKRESPVTDQQKVMEWHKRNGGHQGDLGAHAVRLLHEVVELCLAAGASAAHIKAATDHELKRQLAKPVLDMDLPEEVADVSICLDILAYYAHIDMDQVRTDKLQILNRRSWRADENGVLWRQR